MTTVRPLLRCCLAASVALTALALRAEIAVWTNLDGQAMRAEFIERKGDHVSFRRDDDSKYLYPYAKLSEPDRNRIDALTQPAPEPAAPAKTSAPPVPAPAASLASALSGRLVALRGPGIIPVSGDELRSARFIAFYYSASWCGPCRQFTPLLVAAYKEIKTAHPEFELILISSDQSEKDMKRYMQEEGMPWLALRYDALHSTPIIARPPYERGIPNLVFLSVDGEELSTTFNRQGEYLGPPKVLQDILLHFKM